MKTISKKVAALTVIVVLLSTFVLAGCEPLVAPRARCYCNDDVTIICLQGAVERRWLRREDIRNIAYIHHDGEVRDGQGRVLDFIPTVDTNPVMSEETLNMLENAFGAPFYTRKYYGTFGRSVVFKEWFIFTQGSHSEIVANTYFNIFHPFKPMVWRVP